ncbi:hypothetical protein H4R20_004738 [Coemansia guatemalensis]|uniref:Uncharacterized protein n=1 Tax=Coemansia guatemalensis TaxID=2761395 RepID=A0A9W8LRT2_9FUNG|nr:hypothetical protein H4R20_004738 [Coemansia guatemalensis]
MEPTQNSTSVAWTHRHMDSRSGVGKSGSADSRAFRDRSGIGALGLDLHPNRRFMGAILGSEHLQLHSPTVPNNLFIEDTQPPPLPSPPLPPVADATTVTARNIERTMPSHGTGLESKVRGNYALNPGFMRTQEEREMPPLPPLPKVHPGSFPSYPADMLPKPISFPRSNDESSQNDSNTATPVNGGGGEGGGGYAAAKAPTTTPTPHGQSVRSSNNRQPALYPKRNYSLPAALMPPQPKLALENYEFTSIESLERKWADAKTESTRILSSAIYKYYFSHGEWKEFEQVFPSKVLEAWEEFQSKLSPSELGFLNTVLVSQNPFSSDQGSQEKHVQVLARTIPLSQMVRTMVFSEEMRPRESYSSQGSNGPEIDPEFADWLITRFNSKRPDTSMSPSEPTFEESRKKSLLPPPTQEQRQQKEEKQVAREERAQKPAEQPVERKPREQQHAKPKTPHKFPEQDPAAQAAPPMPKQPETMLHEPVPSHKALGLWPSGPKGARPKSAMSIMSGMSSISLVDGKQSMEQERPRRKFTFGGKSEQKADRPVTPRRPSINMPSIFQSWRKGSRADAPPADDFDMNLPPSPRKKTERPVTASNSISRARRHTHNFFSSQSTESRPSSESIRSSHRITREIQMKDLPPLPPNAAEFSQLSKKADMNSVKATQSASILRRAPGMLAHFSSHTELGQRMAAAFDKPRSTSLTMENAEKARRRPSVAAPSLMEAASTKSSRSRESGSTEIVPACYDWRVAPLDEDINWGFSISPLALRDPVEHKKANASLFVVHAHSPTKNRRGRAPRKSSRDPSARSVSREKSKLSNALTAKLSASTIGPEDTQDSKPEAPSPEQDPKTPDPPEQNSKMPDPPELPKTKMPQSQLGLGVSESAPKPGASNSPAPSSTLAGVRGVLYELAYLSTQGKNVWAKSDHIFTNMIKTGLEVNRIAEQDFFDFCVDELLKASNDASQDLQAMGSKKVAKKLYESFNTKLSTLLAGSAL